MKKNILRFSTVFLMFLIVLSRNLQAQSLIASLNNYGENYEAEKIHVHFDKPAYIAGETIWFKAYLLQGALPAETTKTIYLDWLDEKGNLLFHTVCPVLESSSTGQFEIPTDYKGQTIHVRGYTRWMMNFDTDFLYNKDIPILTAKSLSGQITKTIANLAFFPEGGDVVEAILNQIAFKTTDQWGRPIKIKGTIEASDGTTIDSLITLHDGMGVFNLFPKPGIKYTAKWEDEKGEKHTSALSAISKSGIVLHAEMNSGKPYFAITKNFLTEEDQLEGFVLATMKEHLVFKTSYNLTTTLSVKKNIPTSQLPTGILTITVFDKNSLPIAERILFINNEDYFFTPSIGVKHLGLNKRANNEIEIEIPDSLITNLSISVTDETIGLDNNENIYSNLLLTSDLKGRVYNPAYYFTEFNETKEKHLDLVMLTNGWRRFNWYDLAKNKYPTLKYSKDSNYLALSGSLAGVQRKPTNSESIILLVKEKDANSQILYTPITQAGRFSEADYIFFDTIIVYHQFPKASSYRNASIQFMPDRLPALFNKNKNSSTRFFANISDTIGSGYNYKTSFDRMAALELYQGKTLENVTVRARTKPLADIMDEKYSSGLFSGGDGYKFDLVNDPLANTHRNIFSYLQGKIAGLQIMNNGFSVSLNWRGGTPQVFLDEMKTDIDMISSISVNDIAFIKVFRPPFIAASFGGESGAIAIYTRKGDDWTSTDGKGLHRNMIMGYSSIREFYSPNYDSINPKNEEPDLRTTLFWEPMILTEPGNTKKTISFYNNDVTKKYRIVVEGFSKDGKLAHVEKIVE